MMTDLEEITMDKFLKKNLPLHSFCSLFNEWLLVMYQMICLAGVVVSFKSSLFPQYN